jgi:NAD(P)-dependent dehydrogenase (short-subunit alcohol dehydrogenase family)
MVDLEAGLTGRVALVTGGAGARVGTGAGIAHALARRGAFVVVADRDVDKAEAVAASIEREGGRATTTHLDVRDGEAVVGVVDDVVSRVGPIDILVNSAGGGPLGRFREQDPETWNQIVALNLFGVVNCTRAVLDAMCDRNWGRIVTIASVAAFMGGDIGVTAYAAGKAGAIGFSRQLAVEVAPLGVTVNCVAPGLVGPEDASYDPNAVPGGRPIPAGRAGRPSDIGSLVAYLASEEAAWVTGQTFHINGGSYTT